MLLQFDGLTSGIAKLRDWVIVGAAFNYIVGYVVVATYAVINGFGIVKALDTQYIVAGLLPTAIFCLTFMLWMAGGRRGEKVAEEACAGIQKDLLRGEVRPAWVLMVIHRKKGPSAPVIVSLRNKYLGRFLARPLLILAVSFVALLVGLVWFQALASVGMVVFLMTLIYLVRVAVIIDLRIFEMEEVRPLFPRNAATAKKFSGPIPTLATFGGLLLGYLPLFLLYVLFVFPAIPLEFGGAAKRCVSVVLKDDALRKAIGAPADAEFYMTLELSGDPYVLSTQRHFPKRVWLVPHESVLAMGNC